MKTGAKPAEISHETNNIICWTSIKSWLFNYTLITFTRSHKYVIKKKTYEVSEYTREEKNTLFFLRNLMTIVPRY